MHFEDRKQDREHKVTTALASPGPLHTSLIQALDINRPYWMTTEFDKKKYGRTGDVDIAFVTNPGMRGEAVYAIEVKVMHLTSMGRFQSEKMEKHHKQLDLLEEEGWNRVFLLDVIVTTPTNTWLHPQAFDGYEKFRKKVNGPNVGHIIMQVNSVAHKPETEAGAVSFKILQRSRFLRRIGTLRGNIRNALSLERKNYVHNKRS